jgi:hypothetical protein
MSFAGLFALLVSGAIVGGCAHETEREGEKDGRGEKEGTGRSYAAQTRIERFASPSAASALFDAERVWSGNDDWEPALATQPNSTVVYQAVTRYSGTKACNGCPFPIIIVRKSTDGGNTWGPDRNIPVTKYKQNDPEIEVATDGTLYLAWMDAFKPGIRFAKSSNGGQTWTTPVFLTPTKGGTPNWGDKPLLAISPNGQHVYVAFNASDSYVASSHDYGATFTVSPKTNSDTRYWFHTAGAVAPNGSVYFLTADFSQDYSGDAHIGVLRSTDGGAHWVNTVVDTSKEMPDCPWAAGCTFGFLGTIGGLAIDASGKIMIAYNANNTVRAPMQLYVRTSTNGTSWSARQDIGGGLAVEHHSVAVAAAPGSNGFGVVWQDDRNGANTYFNAWMRRTTDGGSTWDGPYRLSDQATGAPYKSASGHRFPYGDYLEVATDSAGHYHAVWGEGISFTGPGGVWYTKTY